MSPDAPDADYLAQSLAGALTHAQAMFPEAIIDVPAQQHVLNTPEADCPMTVWVNPGMALVRAAAHTRIQADYQLGHEAFHVATTSERLQRPGGGVYHWRHEGLAELSARSFLAALGIVRDDAQWVKYSSVSVHKRHMAVAARMDGLVLDLVDLRGGYPPHFHSFSYARTLVEVQRLGLRQSADWPPELLIGSC